MAKTAIVRSGTPRSSSTEGMSRKATARTLIEAMPAYLKLLGRLIRDPRVSSTDKALLAAAVAYVLMPVDLIPDFVPVLGLLDDLLLLALTVDRLVVRAGPELVSYHWDGPDEALAALTARIDDLERLVPASVRRRLKKQVDRR